MLSLSFAWPLGNPRQKGSKLNPKNAVKRRVSRIALVINIQFSFRQTPSFDDPMLKVRLLEDTDPQTGTSSS